MRFVKMEGLGNDFVVVDGTVRVEPDLVRRLCDRHRGIGADGLLQVSNDGTVVVMGYWNADGSGAEMCGNGLRCVARYALDSGLATGEEFSVLTPAGLRRVIAASEPRVEVGEVEIGEPLTFQGRRFTRVSVGNPHAVTMVEDVGAAPVAAVGAALEAATPGGINVEFVHLVARHRLEMRVWERGVGETLACGSGMVAAAAVALQGGRIEPGVEVTVPGGTGLVELDGSRAWLTGPARYVFEGEIDL
jgi:diaminopimelate epimerase